MNGVTGSNPVCGSKKMRNLTRRSKEPITLPGTRWVRGNLPPGQSSKPARTWLALSQSKIPHPNGGFLPPDVTRDTVDALLGELHIVGKNQWSPFEQAFHLYKMHKKGYTNDQLAQQFRMSKSYVNAKLRAYKMLAETYLTRAQKAKKEVKDLSRSWSWFEEFYKKCKPSAPGKENPDRVFDGPELEQKFCDWVLNDQLPKAEDVRRLHDCLNDKKAMGILERGGSIDKAHIAAAAASRPELISRIWKGVEEVTELLSNIPLSELDALREGDAPRVGKLNALVEALQKVRTEIRAKH
jgi:hypothetical protein